MKTFLNNTLRKVSTKTADRYIRLFGGCIERKGVTWAGVGAYYAVWNISVLINREGRIVGEVNE